MGDKPQKIAIPKYARFILGGVAGCAATCFTQPLDLIKNRMQMSGVGVREKDYKTTYHAIHHVVTNEGFLELYNGLSAGLFRQATYTTARLGMYSLSLETLQSADTPPGYALKIFCGVLAGVAGGFSGTPADVAMIRMCLDGRLPMEERRNYKWVGEALHRIYKEEGIPGLFTGVGPTMIRAMVANAAQLPTYSFSKDLLISSGYFIDNIHTHFWASMVAGFVCSAVGMPFDIAKTRIQNMKPGEAKPEYSGMLDVITKVARYEGVPALWKGFTAYYARLGPQTVLVFIFLEQFTTWYRRYILGDETSVGTGF